MTENERIIEEFIYDYPVCEFYHITKDDLVFSDKVRYICEHECDHYNKSWACPPVIGSIEECMKECDEYDNVFLFTTVAEVADPLNLTETLEAKGNHEKVTRDILKEFKSRFNKAMALSTGCMICKKCAFLYQPIDKVGLKCYTVRIATYLLDRLVLSRYEKARHHYERA